MGGVEGGKMRLEMEVLKAIYDAVYDVFAYRLGPDEWEEAEEHFRIRLKEELIRIDHRKESQ